MLPSLASDYFEFFSLVPKLQIDLEDLQKRFYELSKLLHPDRYQRKSVPEQQYSLDATAVLNDAYRVLRDPLRRAEYVLKQAGFQTSEQRSKDVPAELLEEVFELNMALEEMRDGDASARPQLEEAREKFHALRDEIDARLKTLFAVYDARPGKETLSEIRSILNRRRYIRNLVNDVEKELQ